MVSHEESNDFEDENPYGIAMTAISALDTARKYYFNACITYADAPTDNNLLEVNTMAETHAKAFRIATVVLNSDTEVDEFHDILVNLLIHEDTARASALNSILGAEVLEAMTMEHTEDEVTLSGDAVIIKRFLQNRCANCHTGFINADTQIFVDAVSEVA